MYTLNQISIDTCIPENELIALAIRARFHYRTIEIKKKSGKIRILHAPSYKIKGIQTWILRNILEKYSIHECATGFLRGASIFKNANMHADNTKFLQLDFADFFPSISINAVYGVFIKMGFESSVAKVLAYLCTYRGVLPQGGVTSPYLSNLVMIKFDDEISRFSHSLGYIYTRYADDITISGRDNANFSQVLNMIRAACGVFGLKLNSEKTRYSSGKSSTKITGLFVNAKRPTVGRELKRRIRANIYNCMATGGEISNEIHGQIAFISGIESGYKNDIKNYRQKLAAKFAANEGIK